MTQSINNMSGAYQMAFNKMLADNVGYSGIAPYIFAGYIQDADFGLYSADVLYFALKCDITSDGVPGPAIPYAQFFNAVNASILKVMNTNSHYDTAGSHEHNIANTIEFSGMPFSRILMNGYTEVNFIGFKITL